MLKKAGGPYLHCAPNASHYPKVILDGVFAPGSLRNELAWKRSTSHGNVARNFGALAVSGL